MYPITGEKYRFFNEIQYTDDWELWMRVIHDSKKDIRMIATGSAYLPSLFCISSAGRRQDKNAAQSKQLRRTFLDQNCARYCFTFSVMLPPKTAEPATITLAPASITVFALSTVIPPST